ncbi:hypothetical protein, partial [Pseudomonas syringae group genomosp. 7]|uniref:hypothetical protein n=1 Tax=Pseudomonas syringae group genomosp. 7 TaxID=251699 RepID=UPI0037702342
MVLFLGVGLVALCVLLGVGVSGWGLWSFCAWCGWLMLLLWLLGECCFCWLWGLWVCWVGWGLCLVGWVGFVGVGLVWGVFVVVGVGICDGVCGRFVVMGWLFRVVGVLGGHLLDRFGLFVGVS